MLTGFALAFLIAYAAMFGLYLAFGLAAERLVARRAGRKIQPGRDGMSRKGREIRASARALAVSALLFAAGYAARAAGWGPAPGPPTALNVALWFVALLILFDAWFYAGHRLLHWGPMYRFHALHHRAVAPTVWSNDSSGLVDTLIQHGFYFVIWLVLPAPTLAIVAVRAFDQVSGMIGHSGHEFFAGPTARRPWPFLSTTYHDLHHARFTCNYGNILSLWDRLFGTIDPGYDDAVRQWERRAAK